MLITDGSCCLATWEKAVESWTGLGISSSAASLVQVGVFSARTAVPIRVPIRIPIDRVNSNKVAERSFWVFSAAKKRIGRSPKAGFLDYSRSSLVARRAGAGVVALRDRSRQVARGPLWRFATAAGSWFMESTGDGRRATSA